MGQHAHILHEGAPLEAAARAVFEASGEQWTDMRGKVFAALADFTRPASAYDIAEVVSREEGRRIAANSIYRILDIFVATNLVHKVESANAYIVNAHPDCVHDCIFLVCDACGRTTHVDDDAVSKRVRAAASGAGFLPVRPILEVRGECGDCRRRTEGVDPGNDVRSRDAAA